jgi:hypothetical protein
MTAGPRRADQRSETIPAEKVGLATERGGEARGNGLAAFTGGTIEGENAAANPIKGPQWRTPVCSRVNTRQSRWLRQGGWSPRGIDGRRARAKAGAYCASWGERASLSGAIGVRA